MVLFAVFLVVMASFQFAPSGGWRDATLRVNYPFFPLLCQRRGPATAFNQQFLIVN